MDDLAARLAELPAQTESGLWQRHVAAAAINHALEGRSANGRWGTRGGFPVLYIGRPTESVIVEAYRHLVDPVEVDTPQERDTLIANLTPRVLVTCHVQVTELLDLRTALARANAGLTMQDLESNTEDTQAYARCQQVAQTAHQLGRHGIIAPAATGLGDTLVLFMDILPSSERPARSTPDLPWPQLPPDPRMPARVSLRSVPPSA